MGYGTLRDRFSSLLCLLTCITLQTVRFYEIGEDGVSKGEAKAKFDHRAAVLACAFSSDASHAYSGGLDTSVRECVDFFMTFVLPAELCRTDWILERRRFLTLGRTTTPFQQ
jgi:hypothetical protein